MIFREETDGSQQALTMQQAIALVTASVWDRVWKSLPADCPLGATDDPHASAALVATGGGSVCATGKDTGLYVVSAAPAPLMSSR
ncbi:MULTISPECIES: hypothetical protein [Streptacidiphilus]|uniref:Uncharacterized protein n=1 Tax=Streptacidiphilus cavernicola TaxID=3342716 RepID=A0ABV6UH19_9ACTN|nr:hypothetical protein [Streptacidiphilus jeojiense]